MCTAAFDPTNPNSDLRLLFSDGGYLDYMTGGNSDEFTENGTTYYGNDAKRHRYNANKAASEAAAQEKETIAARAAYQTQFDSISADARGIRQRYAQSLGYNPYFLR